MIAWEVTARWVLHNGKFVFRCPIITGYKIINYSRIGESNNMLTVDGEIKEDNISRLDESIFKDKREVSVSSYGRKSR
jgi:hypothetical protein